MSGNCENTRVTVGRRESREIPFLSTRNFWLGEAGERKKRQGLQLDNRKLEMCTPPEEKQNQHTEDDSKTVLASLRTRNLLLGTSYFLTASEKESIGCVLLLLPPNVVVKVTATELVRQGDERRKFVMKKRRE